MAPTVRGNSNKGINAALEPNAQAMKLVQLLVKR